MDFRIIEFIYSIQLNKYNERIGDCVTNSSRASVERDWMSQKVVKGSEGLLRFHGIVCPARDYKDLQHVR